MTKDEVFAILRQNNPAASLSALRIYADAFVTYAEAAANVAENGAIVAHPRTGEPMDNPYLRVREQAAAQLLKIGSGLETDALWSD